MLTAVIHWVAVFGNSIEAEMFLELPLSYHSISKIKSSFFSVTVRLFYIQDCLTCKGLLNLISQCL